MALSERCRLTLPLMGCACSPSCFSTDPGCRTLCVAVHVAPAGAPAASLWHVLCLQCLPCCGQDASFCCC